MALTDTQQAEIRAYVERWLADQPDLDATELDDLRTIIRPSLTHPAHGAQTPTTRPPRGFSSDARRVPEVW